MRKKLLQRACVITVLILALIGAVFGLDIPDAVAAALMVATSFICGGVSHDMVCICTDKYKNGGGR